MQGVGRGQKKAVITLRFLALLTEGMVAPFMKLDEMEKDQFVGTDDDFSLMH